LCSSAAVSAFRKSGHPQCGSALSNPGWFSKRSGNLKGHPRAARVPKASAFGGLVDKTLTVTSEGGTREIRVEEALQQRTYQDALAGKRTAKREVVKSIIKREAWLAKHAPKPSRRRWPGFPTHSLARISGSS
jgi:hypothetical protein